MRLPFTKEQFVDLFAAYNTSLWPAVLALWLASVAVSVMLLSRRRHDRWILALLAAHWIWSALGYHVAFFARINSAAWMFAALFLLQAALFVWVGIFPERVTFAAWRDSWAPMGWVLVAYSLLYPAINAAEHLSLTKIPTFGVPCPTTIFTAGMLLLATPRCWQLATIPIIDRHLGSAWARRPRRLRPSRCGRCVGDLFNAET